MTTPSPVLRLATQVLEVAVVVAKPAAAAVVILLVAVNLPPLRRRAVGYHSGVALFGLVSLVFTSAVGERSLRGCKHNQLVGQGSVAGPGHVDGWGQSPTRRPFCPGQLDSIMQEFVCAHHLVTLFM